MDLSLTESDVDRTPAERARFVIEALGSSVAVARLLGVSAGQPLRWRAGRQVPQRESARRLTELDVIIRQAHRIWEPQIARIWFGSPNAHLAGARPVDVFQLQGPERVKAALEAAEQGAFA